MSSVIASRIIPRLFLWISLLFIAYPALGIGSSSFVIAQLLFVCALPFFVFEKYMSVKFVVFFAVSLSLFLYTIFFFKSPTFGVLYVLAAILFAKKSTLGLNDFRQVSYVFAILSLSSIILSFVNGADRVVFFKGDPNFTAFWLGFLLILYQEFKFCYYRVVSFVLVVGILFSFSRSGLLFLILFIFYRLYMIFYPARGKIKDGTIFILTQFVSILISSFLMLYLFNNEMPDYVYRYGFEKYSFESFVDISNYIRLRANIFFFDPELFDVIFFGAPSNEIVAFDYRDKFIRPHNFMMSMIFEFGIFFTSLIFILGVYRRQYWGDRSYLILLVVFGSTLGFSYYYGFVIFLITIFSDYFESKKCMSLKPRYSKIYL